MCLPLRPQTQSSHQTGALWGPELTGAPERAVGAGQTSWQHRIRHLSWPGWSLFHQLDRWSRQAECRSIAGRSPAGRSVADLPAAARRALCGQKLGKPFKVYYLNFSYIYAFTLKWIEDLISIAWHARYVFWFQSFIAHCKTSSILTHTSATGW